MSAGGRGGGEHGGSGNQGGGGSGRDAKGSGGNGGGAFQGGLLASQPLWAVNRRSGAPLPPAGLLAAAAPQPTQAPMPQAAQPLATQGLMSQPMPQGNPFGDRFGPMHPLLQYLIGQIPGSTPAPGLTATDPMAMLKKRFGDPRTA